MATTSVNLILTLAQEILIRKHNNLHGNAEYYCCLYHSRFKNDDHFLRVSFHCYLKSSCVRWNNGTLVYKYMLFTPQIAQEDDAYEFLHEVPSSSSPVNRAIEIPLFRCKPKGK